MNEEEGRHNSSPSRQPGVVMSHTGNTTLSDTTWLHHHYHNNINTHIPTLSTHIHTQKSTAEREKIHHSICQSCNYIYTTSTESRKLDTSIPWYWYCSWCSIIDTTHIMREINHFTNFITHKKILTVQLRIISSFFFTPANTHHLVWLRLQGVEVKHHSRRLCI